MCLVLVCEPPHATVHALQVDQDESWQSTGEVPWHGAAYCNEGHAVPPQKAGVCTFRLLCRVPDCPHCTVLQADQEDQWLTWQSTLLQLRRLRRLRETDSLMHVIRMSRSRIYLEDILVHSYCFLLLQRGQTWFRALLYFIWNDGVMLHRAVSSCQIK